MTHTVDGLTALARVIEAWDKYWVNGRMEEDAVHFIACINGFRPLASTPQSALRMLTEREVLAIMAITGEPHYTEIIQRRFAEVNGLTLASASDAAQTEQQDSGSVYLTQAVPSGDLQTALSDRVLVGLTVADVMRIIGANVDQQAIEAALIANLPPYHPAAISTGDDDEEVDDYGNPLSGDRIIYCCFPDCGCDGARLCTAERGASSSAMSLNIERGSIAKATGSQP